MKKRNPKKRIKVVHHWLIFPLFILLIVISIFTLHLLSVNRYLVVQTTLGQSIPIKHDLISLWSGDGNANDSIDGNSGILVGGVTFSQGIKNQAFNFNGVDSYMHVSTAANLNPTGSFSITAWIFPREDILSRIVDKWGDMGVWINQRSYAFGTQPEGVLDFGISDEAHQADHPFHNFTSPHGVIKINSWNNVAAVYDQSTGTRMLYVNGDKVAERIDPPITIKASIADLAIGGRLSSPTSVSLFFSGLIDEVRFYDGALTKGELRALFVTQRLKHE